MNREERRNEKKEITFSELHEILDQERLRVIDLSVDYLTASMAMVMYDKLGMGKKKIQMALTEVGELFDSIVREDISIDLIYDTLKVEAGITLRRKERK